MTNTKNTTSSAGADDAALRARVIELIKGVPQDKLAEDTADMIIFAKRVFHTFGDNPIGGISKLMMKISMGGISAIEKEFGSIDRLKELVKEYEGLFEN